MRPRIFKGQVYNIEVYRTQLAIRGVDEVPDVTADMSFNIFLAHKQLNTWQITYRYNPRYQVILYMYLVPGTISNFAGYRSACSFENKIPVGRLLSVNSQRNQRAGAKKQRTRGVPTICPGNGYRPAVR